MAKLQDKIENGLNDVRILILGGQVLIGANMRLFFEPDFDYLPGLTQKMQLVGLAFMLLGLGPLMLPAAYHRIVNQGEDTVRLRNVLNTSLSFGLLPFAVGLATAFFMSAEKVIGRAAGWGFGLAAGGLALMLWYGIEFIKRNPSRKHMARKQDEQDEHEGRRQGGVKITEKIKQVLTEIRMVLPGSQALLGFQFVIIVMSNFDKLPASSRFMHLASLTAVAISTILLITPAAYHRIVERGEDSERFHNFAGRLLLWAMFFLALGLAGDFYVIARKISNSVPFAIWSAAVLFLFFCGLWFGYCWWKRQQVDSMEGETA